MHRRLKILDYWLKGHRYGVSLPDLVRCLVAPTHKSSTRRYIREIVEEDDFLAVYYRADPTKPLYFPKNIGLAFAYQITDEMFDPSNWHYYCTPETPVVQDDIVVDCGAAEGLFAWTTATIAKEVYAIEPLPAFVASMAKTFAGFSNVHVIPKLLSDKSGSALIRDYGMASRLDPSEGTEVPMVTLDELFQGVAVSYIKADLEGYEVTVLKGARELIRANGPKIAITTYHVAEQAKEIADLLQDIRPDYQINYRGISPHHGGPFMIHAVVR